jgi:monofunctional chorismate mutase
LHFAVGLHARRRGRSVQYRGIRGATTVEVDSAAAILDATRELLARIVRANVVAVEDVASALDRHTGPDYGLSCAGGRQLGWQQVALLDAQEIPVPEGLPRCVRV